MKWIAVLSTTLWIGFSPVLAPVAFAMSYPVYVDATCESMVEARATPRLKAWLKAQRRFADAETARDLEAFVKDVAGNNENWRRKCGGEK